VAFFEHIDQYHRLCSALLGQRGSTSFAAKMRASLTEMVKSICRCPKRRRARAALGSPYGRRTTGSPQPYWGR
jgi:hypothetical protein